MYFATIKDSEKNKELASKIYASRRLTDAMHYKLEQLERTLDEVVRYQDDDRILLLSLNTRILRLEKKLYGKSMDGWLDQETGAMKRIQKEEETGNIQENAFVTLPTYRKIRARRFVLDHL